jgi:mannose-6-phosphate isomerase-like protein (cupin superfamily)
MHKAKSTASFPQPEDLGFRQWGAELLGLKVPGKFTAKKITMHQGAKGGLQYHHKKDEGGYVISGRAVVRYDPGDGSLTERVVAPDDWFWFPQGCVHQVEALEPFSYLEVSTPFLNDRVHVEKDYGIAEEAGGLPSTTLEEVELI